MQRSILRPLDPKLSMTAKDIPKDQSTPLAKTSPPLIALVAAGAVLLLAVVSLIRASQPPPNYASASDCMEMILAQERAGQWEVAATNARTCLTRPNLSPNDTGRLVDKALTDALRALSAKPINPGDYNAQQQAVDTYQDLKLLAADKQVPLPKTFYQIAEDAANTGRFLLARAALQDAFDQGDLSGANFPHVRFTHDVTYNLGWWLTRNAPNPHYEDGLSLLVAADHLDRQYRLGIGLAAAQLKPLAPDETGRPSPAKTPMLNNDSNE